MTFLLPFGLFALLLLPVVALLHLIQQRRERRQVPSLQIWRDLQRQTVQKKPRRLPLTLLLLLHLLLTALLALALGQPLLQAVRAQTTHTAIIVDTSTSMAAADVSTNRLEAAKAAARDLIDGLGRSDSAAVIELSTQPQIVAQGAGNDTASMTQALAQLRAGGADGDLAQAINLAQATARTDRATRIVVLTDRALRAPATIAAAAEIEWQTFGGNGDNVAIVAFATRPLRNGQQQLYARVANLGTQPIARTLQLDLDGSRATTEPMRLAPGAEAEWSWPLPAGTTRAEASMSGNDVQPLDDRAVAVVGDALQTRVVLVSATTTPLQRALQAQPGFSVQTIAPAEYTAELEADLVVFNAYVPPSLPQAAMLIVAPPADQTVVEVQGDVLDVRASDVRDDRFGAIDFNPVTFDRVAQITPPEWASVAVASDGVPLVLTGHLDDQPIAIWAFDPGASNISNRLAFPLLTAATARTLLPQANTVLLVGARAPFALIDPSNQVVAAGTRLTQPGLYTAESGGGAIAVNVLDADEADLQQRAQPALTEIPRTVVAESTPVGREVWQPLVIGALLVLIGEWVYTHRGRFGRKPRVQVR